MMNKNKLTDSINLLVSDPMVFSTIGWYAFESDRGTCCTEKATVNEKEIYLMCRDEIENIMPNGSALANQAVESFRVLHDRHFIQYRFATNAMARFLSGIDSYEVLENMVRASLKYKAEACLIALKKTERRL